MTNRVLLPINRDRHLRLHVNRLQPSITACRLPRHCVPRNDGHNNCHCERM